MSEQQSDSQVRFGHVGQGARSEDLALITGRGNFTSDLAVDDVAHAAFLRTPIAHASIRSIDTKAARAMPGVLAVLTGEDLARDDIGGIPPAIIFKGRDGAPMFTSAMPLLAQQKVRYVGEPVAMVVAATLPQALDAAEAVVVDYDDLPAVPTIAQAFAVGAAQLWAGAAGNLAMDWEDGDAAAVDTAFAQAAHVARESLFDNRLAPASMETRAAIGQWDAASGRYTLTATTQGVAIVRKMLAEFVFKLPADKLRVLTPDVGGGFGMKSQTYSEFGAVMWAAKKVGRPVRWIATRLESFLGDTAGRDGLLEGELAFDRDGRMLALRIRNQVGMGAYLTQFAGVFATNNTKNCLASVYTIPMVHTRVKMALTNTAPLGPYRGAGRPEAILMIERLIDAAAKPLGIDRVEIRRRNLIPQSAMPYKTPVGMVYDSGDFAGSLDKALAAADWKGFTARRASSERAGKLRGIGVCCFLEVAGGILDETVDLRFADDGFVEMRTGVQAMGQGHYSTFPPFIARALDIDVAKIRVIQGDSDEVPPGTPSVASRSIMMAGSAMYLAAEEAIKRGKEVAGRLLETNAADIEYGRGEFRVSGTDRRISIFELAKREKGALDNNAKFVSPMMSFPSGCHVSEVEIDPTTGLTAIVNYVAVDDVGTVLHETIVEGQVHGGVAQGLGQVLGENVVYDTTGQLLTASFMDYVMPRADDLPPMTVLHNGTPCTTNPIGAKGAGESGVAGSLPSTVNAVLDALAARGITALELPMTPEKVWRALASAPS